MDTLALLRNALQDWKKTNLLVLAALALIGVIYLANTWSPSSYGFFLQSAGQPENGPDWGTPRPIRSDEWAVLTPLTQATVNNHFQRYNLTSAYQEDLRINYTLPIHDWGMLFKPTQWGYLFANPAYAYSFSFFAVFLLFIFGYAHLFRLLQATPLQSFLLSSCLFFTGFVQFWWNEKGPALAFFPWVITCLFWNVRLRWKLLAYYWLACCWFFANFYPPLFISLAFVGALLIAAQRPALLKGKTVLALALVSLLAVGTSLFYLQDYLAATASTIYPGHRVSSGGEVSFKLWLLQWFPTAGFTRDYEALLPPNICEIGVVGSCYALLVLCCLDYRAVFAAGRATRPGRALTFFLIGLALTWVWLLLPLPSWLGWPLLWNRVPGNRMWFASGLLLFISLFVLAREHSLSVTPRRMALFIGLTLLGSALFKFGRPDSEVPHGFIDLFLDELWIMGVAVALFFFCTRRPEKTHDAVLASAALLGLLVFFNFNPLQSAQPIFNRAPSLLTRGLDTKAALFGGREMVVDGFPGATLNGLGYNSISHVTPVPHLDFWRKKFPDMPAEQFNAVFNRYAHINFSSKTLPESPQPDRIDVPYARLVPPPRLTINTGQPLTLPSAVIKRQGMIDQATLSGRRLILRGWAPWLGPLAQREMHVSPQPAPARIIAYGALPRNDVEKHFQMSALAYSGFQIVLEFPDNVPLTPERLRLCIYTHDLGSPDVSQLINPNGLADCK